MRLKCPECENTVSFYREDLDIVEARYKLNGEGELGDYIDDRSHESRFLDTSEDGETIFCFKCDNEAIDLDEEDEDEDDEFDF